MHHTAAAIAEWLHQGTGARAPPGHDSPPIEEIRAGLWLPFRARLFDALDAAGNGYELENPKTFNQTAYDEWAQHH